MANKKVLKKTFGEEILVGDSKKKNHNSDGKNPPMPYDKDYTGVNLSDIDRILNFPSIDDMAGCVARSYFKTDDERIAYLRVIQRLKKFGLTSRLEFIRNCLASKLGMMAFGKTLQLQSKIELIAPAVIREQLAMKRIKSREETVRGSDFRQETESKEPRVKE